MSILDKIKDFFGVKLKYTFVTDKKRNVIIITCNKKHKFKVKTQYTINVNNETLLFKVLSIVDKHTIECKYFTPAIYCWTNSIYQNESLYKVGVTNWQTVIDRVNQTYTTGVAEKPRLVHKWDLDVSTPKDAFEIEKTIHSKLNRYNKNREFFKNDFKTEIKPVVEQVISDFKANKIKPDGISILPRYYQYFRKELALEYYLINNSGWFQSACGTGKGYDGFWIYDILNKNKIFNNSNGIVILFIPSLYLLEQSTNDFKLIAEEYSYDVRSFQIGSKENASTNIKNIIGFLNESTSDYINLISCTYQSYKILQNALILNGTIVDFAIYDEAHRLTGSNKKDWLNCIKYSVIPSQKKLSMTASPILYTHESIGFTGMNNNIFGQCFHEYSYSDGVEDGYLTPIEIYALEITEPDIENLENIINNNCKIAPNGLFKNDIEGYSAFIIQLHCALLAFKNNFFTHAIYYSNTISRSEYFIDYINELAPQYNVELNYSKVLTGDDSPKNRMNELKNGFTLGKKSIVANAKCLQEGINISCVDGIGLIDPKESLPELIQVIGRGSRLHKNKDKCAVIIPVVIKKDSNDNIIIDKNKGYWKNTINILINLCASNDDIKNIILSNGVKFIENSNLRNGITIKQNIEKEIIRQNISGSNISDTKKPEKVFEFEMGEFINSIEFNKIIDGYKIKKVFDNNDEIEIKKRVIDYSSYFEYNIDEALRNFNKKKNYSKFLKTEKSHIEDFSNLNNRTIEQAETELSSFLQKIKDKQRKLESLILFS
jgi:predicted helicase